ncbi:DinB family protein [Halobacillus salinarum]|uniref:DinB family protein n=1 Tax=Halobacillus salinarum TaxID=2932257 RepID=A0ABY4ELX1_9BACI|nr:DinB family protein [Halobacillus salinarum]UOQ45076.1 DinB family protein [Halobacillus salinarum]
MSRSEQFINYFLSHREVLNELIEKIEHEHYTYKPTPTSMEAQKLVNHILESMYMFANIANKQQPGKLYEEEDSTPLPERAKNYTDKTVELIHALSDEDMEEIVDVKKMLGRDIPAGSLLHLGLDHEIHHKGQLFVYVREMGHTELPFYIRNE